MDGGTNGMMNESPPVFYRTSSPSGPLPCFPSLQFTITQSRATGIADHILPLGDLFRSEISPKRLISTLSYIKSPLSGPKLALSDLEPAFLHPKSTLFSPKLALPDSVSPPRPVFSPLWPELCPMRPQICPRKPKI